MSYDTAWSTCLGLAPAGQWRVPSSSDIELGRHANGGLFILTYSYWSSSPYFDAFWAWNPAYSYWDNCNAAGTYCTYYGYVPMALRCVSNS